jgi:hypothetical protein
VVLVDLVRRREYHAVDASLDRGPVDVVCPLDVRADQLVSVGAGVRVGRQVDHDILAREYVPDGIAVLDIDDFAVQLLVLAVCHRCHVVVVERLDRFVADVTGGAGHYDIYALTSWLST